MQNKLGGTLPEGAVQESWRRGCWSEAKILSEVKRGGGVRGGGVRWVGGGGGALSYYNLVPPCGPFTNTDSGWSCSSCETQFMEALKPPLAPECHHLDSKISHPLWIITHSKMNTNMILSDSVWLTRPWAVVIVHCDYKSVSLLRKNWKKSHFFNYRIHQRITFFFPFFKKCFLFSYQIQVY